MRQREIRVIEIATGKIVHTIQIGKDKSESQIMKIMSGLLRNMDREKFCLEDVV